MDIYRRLRRPLGNVSVSLRRYSGVYTDMEQWRQIRRQVLVEGVSKRQIMRKIGLHFRTINKILTHRPIRPVSLKTHLGFSKNIGNRSQVF